MSVANIIRGQILAVDRFALGAWGAKELINMGNGLKFKTSGMVRWKGYVYVKYDEGQDLYNIDFFRVRGVEIKYDKKVEGVFAEDLVQMIDAQVG
jgi:hypothetical protein